MQFVFSGKNNHLIKGFTWEEEKSLVRDYWPKINCPNANFKLYGASQLQRVLYEFRLVVQEQCFPYIDDSNIVNAFGFASKQIAGLKATEDLLEVVANKQLKPLFHGLIERCHFIVRHVFQYVLTKSVTFLTM